MSAERPILSGTQVSQAEKRVGLIHPVIAVLDSHLDIFTQIKEDFSRLYVFGTTESPMELGRKLAIRIRDGDEEARIEYDQLIAREEQRDTPLLGEVRENFANGFSPVYWPIDEALKALDS